MSALLIDTPVVSQPVNATPPASTDAPDPGSEGQSFHNALAREMRNQASDNAPPAAGSGKPGQIKDKKHAKEPDSVPDPTAVQPDPGAWQLHGAQANILKPASPATGTAAERADAHLKPAPLAAAKTEAKEILAPQFATEKDQKLAGKPDVSARATRQAPDPAEKAVGPKRPEAKDETPAALPGAAVQQDRQIRPAINPFVVNQPIQSIPHGGAALQQSAAIAATHPQSGDQAKNPQSPGHDAASTQSAEAIHAGNPAPISVQSPPLWVQPATQAEPAPVVSRIDVPVDAQAWNNALSQQVIMLVSNSQQQAEIHLNPQEMGPIKVTITLDNNQASLSFIAREGATRQAIESALPRLSEMMAGSGISLGQTNVQADTSGNFTQPGQPERTPVRGSSQMDNRDETPVAQAISRTAVQVGLVDRFA